MRDGLFVYLNAADLAAGGLETLVALVARQLLVVYVAAGGEPPASPPLGPGVLRRLESRRTRLARQKDAARWAGADGAGRAAFGINLGSLAGNGVVALGLPPVSLHSAEVTHSCRSLRGQLRATARAVVRSVPVRAKALKYDMRVFLLRR